MDPPALKAYPANEHYNRIDAGCILHYNDRADNYLYNTMNQNNELPFPRFQELIRGPLEISDPASFKVISSLLLDSRTYLKDPFKFIIAQLTGLTVRPIESEQLFEKIIKHKQALALKLARNISIRVAAIDFFDQQHDGAASPGKIFLPLAANTTLRSNDSPERPYALAPHLQRFKEEMLRATRYKHSLAVILLDVDNFHDINEIHSSKIGDDVLTLLVKIIEITVRTIDILARHSGARFLLVLPNTNKREATELAQRLVTTVRVRSRKLVGLSEGFTITASVRQCEKNDTPATSIQYLEGVLMRGKSMKCDAVYTE